MHDLIDKLQALSEPTPIPLELPDFDQLVEVEEAILLPLPAELKEYLLSCSNVIYGSFEPITVADPASHTYLPEVAAYAWSVGLPRELLPICQQGDDYYCMDQQGQVYFWQNGEFNEDSWESIWDWVENIWIA